MHSIPQLVADIQSIAFSPRGTPEFIQAVMGGGVPAIIHALPHLVALEDPTEAETETLRQTCEQIISAQWGWPLPGGTTSLVLAAQTLPTLPAKPVPEVQTPVAPMMPEHLTAPGVAADFLGGRAEEVSKDTAT